MPSTVEVARGTAVGTAFNRGRDIYNLRCYFCHGYNGDAKTLAASYLSPPPRDFTATAPQQLSRERMIEVVTHGKTGTAMQGFAGQLSADDIAAVVDFVRENFMSRKGPASRYHTASNGWPDHDRYSAAFPFATGEIALDRPVETLTDAQRDGRQLYMSSCVTCHDRARSQEQAELWNRRAISFPRRAPVVAPAEAQVDAVSGASPYALHDEEPPPTGSLSPQEQMGRQLFQANCAFCHGADGTGFNWIGSFLQPHPRDLTAPAKTAPTEDRLRRVIRDGLPGTTMSAWKNVFSPEQIDAVTAYVLRTFVQVERNADLDNKGTDSDGRDKKN